MNSGDHKEYTHVFLGCGTERFPLYESQVLGLLSILASRNVRPLHILFEGGTRPRQETVQRLRNWNALGFSLILPYSKAVTALSRKAVASSLASWILRNLNIRGRHPEIEKVLLHCRNEPATLWGISIAAELSSLARRAGVQLIVRVLFDNRGLRTEEVKELNPRAIATNAAHIASKWWVSERVSAYSFVTGAMADHYLSHGYRDNIPSIIVPTCVNGSDYSHCNIPWNDREFDLVYCGSTWGWQGVDRVLNLLMKMDADHSIRALALVDEPEVVQQRADQLGLHNLRIKRLPAEHVPAALSQCRIGLLFRDSSLLNQVAAPTKLGEYLAAGLKVAYTGDIGSVKDLLASDSNAEQWLVNLSDLDSHELIDVISRELDSSPPEGEIWKYFTWEHHLHKYSELF
ncbi:MAG: hypothetical protein CVV64_14660 [Candidatus Wallbacteria bacterium HGW-Wallbacteria-1]|jgi:hypothetical protein|uniref:Glycosyltransferase subfamily 4-like N-terminal domain-containing protein n=1 Tax=Candidatus Wallbacteria bacterium HGW-Wallbacteria-1 TaxID=2013854 RepID=A0A2N1PM01_9BACT|nr:MAG: hypothetical protein CVV64_14660 [Candidatus Wallbacteria bacterium HGW-Wallbacteria-1]